MNQISSLTLDAPHVTKVGTITYYPELEQGSDEWLQARCGLLTASEVKLILTPMKKPSANDKDRAHLYKLLAQRITGYVPPHYISDDMLRGKEDEIEARIVYAEKYAPVEETGFITNNKWGFIIGYSPDGLVGDDGLIECKSRRQEFQVQTVLDHIPEDTIPAEYEAQIQTGLMVSERKWCDFISYSGGLPMATIRVYPDPKFQAAIIDAATAFEWRIAEKLERYHAILKTNARLIPTERKIVQEMYI